MRDLALGQWSEEALLLVSAVSRLHALGVPIPQEIEVPDDPELALYASLGRHRGDPYGRYNALRRELDSFIACLEARVARSSAYHDPHPAIARDST